MDMKLSIVIPIYNAEKYIEDCLASILPEMDDEIELLLIDDGSTDSSYMLYNAMKKAIFVFCTMKTRVFPIPETAE